jgi:hypothetical protein
VPVCACALRRVPDVLDTPRSPPSPDRGVQASLRIIQVGGVARARASVRAHREYRPLANSDTHQGGVAQGILRDSSGRAVRDAVREGLHTGPSLPSSPTRALTTRSTIRFTTCYHRMYHLCLPHVTTACTTCVYRMLPPGVPRGGSCTTTELSLRSLVHNQTWFLHAAQLRDLRPGPGSAPIHQPG